MVLQSVGMAGSVRAWRAVCARRRRASAEHRAIALRPDAGGALSGVQFWRRIELALQGARNVHAGRSVKGDLSDRQEQPIAVASVAFSLARHRCCSFDRTGLARSDEAAAEGNDPLWRELAADVLPWGFA